MEALDQAFNNMESSLNTETPTENTEKPVESKEASELSKEQAQEIILDKMEKFKFGDREWTPDQLRKAMMLHSDYTKKTQSLAENRKYYDNLGADLDAIKANPKLADEFKKIYPKEFHKYLGYVTSSDSSSEQVSHQTQNSINPELQSRFERLENYVKEKEVQAYEAQLDAKFSALKQKYPNAVEDVVLAKAQTILDSGTQLTDQVWDKLWKQSDEFMVKQFENIQKQRVEKQKAAGNAAKGPGPGGGAPGQAPKRMTMNEATEQAIRDLTQ